MQTFLEIPPKGSRKCQENIGLTLKLLFTQLAVHIHSPEFAADARHAEFPNAFTRSRKLPLLLLIAFLLSLGGQSLLVMLDAFFGSLAQDGSWQRNISDRGFSKARIQLSVACLPQLNTFLTECADALGLFTRWCGLRVVGTDAIVMMPSVRPCLT